MVGIYLTDSVIIKTTTYDKWSEPSYSQKTIDARIEYETHLVTNQGGEEVVSSAKVTMKYRTLSHEDRIEFDGINHAILQIKKANDFSNQFLIVDVA